MAPQTPQEPACCQHYWSVSDWTYQPATGRWVHAEPTCMLPSPLPGKWAPVTTTRRTGLGAPSLPDCEDSRSIVGALLELASDWRLAPQLGRSPIVRRGGDFPTPAQSSTLSIRTAALPGY